MKRRLFELVTLEGSALILSGALLAMILETERTPLEGNPAWRMVLAIDYLAVALVVLPWYREILFIARRNWVLISMIALAVVSCLWAEMPDLVLRKCMGLLGSTLFGLALAIRVSFEDQLRMLSWLFRALSILSIGCILFFPAYGISSDGEWMGVFDYKNATGTAMGLSLLVEWQLPATTRLSKVLKGLAILLSAVILLNADSITPVVGLAGTFFLLTIYKLTALRWRMPLYAVSFIIGALSLAALSLILANSDAVMGLVGRSSNLTGRTEIWGLVISIIPQRPILGFGYSGFWMGASPESYMINRVMHGVVMYSHNGYLEMFLNLGIVGLLLTILLIGTGLRRSVWLSKQRLGGAELWPLTFGLYFILHNLGECTILQQGLEWGIFVSCLVGTDSLLLTSRVEEEVELPLVPAENLS